MTDRPIRALSIRQPWAWAIIHAGKDFENRTWPTRYRGPVFIHAGVAFDDGKAEALRDIQYWAKKSGVEAPATVEDIPRGGIVGIAEIVDCVHARRADMQSEWFFGPYGFALRNARPLPFLPCKGALGFFEPPAAAVELANRPICEEVK